MTLTRDRALALVHEYTASDALRKHMYAVEIAMRAMAVRAGEDADAWGTVGLLHDFDYERFPNAAHAPDTEHPSEGVRILAGLGAPDSWQRAILGHAAYTGVPRETPMARALFGVDELCGFLVACALVRPSRSLADLEPKSVLKKLKVIVEEWIRLRDTAGVVLPRPEGSTTYVVCKSGGRSMRAAQFLAEQGVETINVAGGTMAWVQSGRSVVTGDRPS